MAGPANRALGLPVVLVHGAFAESASWNGVVEQLQANAIRVLAAANPLRSLPGDAAYVRDVLRAINGPVVLAGHSYAGMVITECAARPDQVAGLVFVNAFAPAASSRPTCSGRRPRS